MMREPEPCEFCHVARGFEHQSFCRYAPPNRANVSAQNAHGGFQEGYRRGWREGAEQARIAAVEMLERARQPAAALGVSLMKLPDLAQPKGGA